MSDSNTSPTPEKEVQTVETQATTPEPKVENNQPEPKAEKPKVTKEDNLKYFKSKFENEEKAKLELAERLSQLEKSLKGEKLERVKTEVKNQALELGLNPTKKAIFEKHFLNNLSKEEDVSQALATFKEEMPEFFGEPKVNLTKTPSGGNIQPKKVEDMDTEQFLTASNN